MAVHKKLIPERQPWFNRPVLARDAG